MYAGHGAGGNKAVADGTAGTAGTAGMGMAVPNDAYGGDQQPGAPAEEFGGFNDDVQPGGQ